MSILVRNRSFHFSRFVQIISNIAPRGLRNWGLLVLLSSKTWQERGLKNIQKTITRKVRKCVKKVVKKSVPKSCFFWYFWIWGRRRPRVLPRTPPITLQGQILSKIVQKWWAKFLTSIRFDRSCLRLGGKTWGGCLLGASWVLPGCLLGASWVLPWLLDASWVLDACLDQWINQSIDRSIH